MLAYTHGLSARLVEVDSGDESGASTPAQDPAEVILPLAPNVADAVGPGDIAGGPVTPTAGVSSSRPSSQATHALADPAGPFQQAELAVDRRRLS